MDLGSSASSAITQALSHRFYFVFYRFPQLLFLPLHVLPRYQVLFLFALEEGFRKLCESVCIFISRFAIIPRGDSISLHLLRGVGTSRRHKNLIL